MKKSIDWSGDERFIAKVEDPYRRVELIWRLGWARSIIGILSVLITALISWGSWGNQKNPSETNLKFIVFYGLMLINAHIDFRIKSLKLFGRLFNKSVEHVATPPPAPPR